MSSIGVEVVHNSCHNSVVLVVSVDSLDSWDHKDLVALALEDKRLVVAVDNDVVVDIVQGVVDIDLKY